jgi:hypothetical protein
MGVPKESYFLAEVDSLTLENDLMRRAGVFRECHYGLHLKRDHMKKITILICVIKSHY